MAAEITGLKAMRDHILLNDADVGERTSMGGIVLMAEIKGPQWCKVYSTGPQQKDVKVGQWVCVSAGIVSGGVEITKNSVKSKVRQILSDDVIMVTDDFDSNMVKEEDIKVIGEQVLVTDMGFTERLTNNGIILLNDNGSSAGIRPRWGKVYAVGPEQKDIKVGEWVCVTHGRWTRGIDVNSKGKVITVRRIDTDDILLVTDEEPQDETMSTALTGM